MTDSPSIERLDAAQVLAAVNAATQAALDDTPAFSHQAKRDGTFALYLRALGIGVALVGAELSEIREELHNLTKATYAAGGF